MSRKDDIENLIREAYAIIREYEKIILFSDRPEEKARSELTIKQQWENIKRLIPQYELVANDIPDDIAEIANYFSNRLPQSAIRILFMSADPTDISRLRLSEEFREIDEQLRLSKLRERFKLELPQLSLRAKDISWAMLNFKPQIVHFSGHGSTAGELCFENEIGQQHLIRPESLAALFEQFTNQVNCVLLNACYSELQAKVIASHINYVIGMKYAIGDKAAIAFSTGFYQALGAGRTVEEAYKLGCVQISLQGIQEHLTPVLIKKDTRK